MDMPSACFDDNQQCINVFETCQGMSLRYDSQI